MEEDMYYVGPAEEKGKILVEGHNNWHIKKRPDELWD